MKMQRGMNVLALVKDSERYVFLYDDDSSGTVLQTLGRYAADTDLSFTWSVLAALRDYVELSGDRRSGGWEGYLQRSEDFIRFTAHMMIVEMLTEHGGEAKRRLVFKRRNRN